MKKFIIVNLMGGSIWCGMAGFVSHPLVEAVKTFDTWAEADGAALRLSSTATRKTKDNQFWAVGSILTVMEVYV